MHRARPFVLIAVLATLPFVSSLRSGDILLPLDILHHQGPFAASIPHELLHVKNPHLADMVIQFYPWLDFFRAAGTGLPLWNPYSFCGSPLLANGQTTFLFPLTWVSLIMPAAPGILCIAIGKLLFCGVFAFLYYRKLGLRESASLLGSLTYMLSGHVTAWLGYPGSCPIVTLPFLFWSLERYLSLRRARQLALLAAAYGLLFISGQPQTGLVIALASLLYFMMRARTEHLPPIRLSLQLAVAAVTGFCLASPQILPFLEYLRESAAFHLRSSLGWKPYPWFTLISCAVPRFFGDLRTGNFWGFSSHLGEAVYVGVVPLVLASMGLVIWRRSRQYSGTLAVLMFGILGLYISPAQWLLSHIPLLSQLDNNKLLVLVTFGLTSLAAGGFHEIFSSPRDRILKLWAVMAIVWSGLVVSGFVYFWIPIHDLSLTRFEFEEIFWCAGLLILASGALLAYRLMRVGPSLLAPILVILAIVDLFRFCSGYYPAFPSRYLRPKSTSLEYLQNHAGSDRFVGVGGELPPETSLLYRLQDARGYDALTPYRHYLAMGRIDSTIHDFLAQLQAGKPEGTRWTPSTLYYLSLKQYLESMDPVVIDTLRHIDYWSSEIQRIERPNLLSIMGIRYVLCNSGNPLLRRTKMRLVHTSDAEIWENPDALPRAFIAAGPIFAKSDSAALDLISDPAFDFRTSAVIFTGVPAPGNVNAGSRTTELIPVNISNYSPDSVQLEADSPHGGWLVLSDLYFPGWRATVDGADTPIFPANYLFRAVRVEPGHHVVAFTYRPSSLYAGLVLCSVAFVAIIGMIVL